jgi:hypothetical protein
LIKTFCDRGTPLIKKTAATENKEIEPGEKNDNSCEMSFSLETII